MMFLPLLPKNPRNAAEARTSAALKPACVIGAPLGMAAAIVLGFAVRHKFPTVSDDYFAYGVVAALVVFSFSFTFIFFRIFLVIVDMRGGA